MRTGITSSRAAQPNRSEAVLAVEQTRTEWHWSLSMGALPIRSKLDSFKREQLAMRLLVANVSHLFSPPRDAFPHSSAYTAGHSKTMGWMEKLDNAPSIVASSESTRQWYLRLGDCIPDFFFMHLYQADLTDVNLSLCEPIPNQLVLGQWTNIERLNLNFL